MAKRICELCDDRCSGKIRRQDFYDCLAAFEVDEEPDSNNSQTFTQKSLLKFAKLLFQNNLKPSSVFD